MANTQSNDVFGSSKVTEEVKATTDSTQAKGSAKKNTPTTDDSKAAAAKTAKSAKSEETKTEAAKKVETEAAVTEVKAAESKPAARKTRAKTTDSKTTAKKTTKKAETKETAAKKTTAAKTTAKKTTRKSAANKEVVKSLFIQHGGKQVDEASLYERVIKDCENQNVTVEELKLYVKPEDNACYYVANGNVAGKVDLY